MPSTRRPRRISRWHKRTIDLRSPPRARWQALAGTPAVSKQEVDVQAAGAAARKAEMEVSAQDVARYAALEAFKRVVAPFDGVVTARLTDVGSYVNAAGGDVSARGNSTELFTVADVHEMRVFVSVPQDYANLLGLEHHGDAPSALATGKIHRGEIPDDGAGIQHQHANGGDGADGGQFRTTHCGPVRTWTWCSRCRPIRRCSRCPNRL